MRFGSIKEVLLQCTRYIEHEAMKKFKIVTVRLQLYFQDFTFSVVT